MDLQRAFLWTYTYPSPCFKLKNLTGTSWRQTAPNTPVSSSLVNLLFPTSLLPASKLLHSFLVKERLGEVVRCHCNIIHILFALILPKLAWHAWSSAWTFSKPTSKQILHVWHTSHGTCTNLWLRFCILKSTPDARGQYRWCDIWCCAIEILIVLLPGSLRTHHAWSAGHVLLKLPLRYKAMQ